MAKGKISSRTVSAFKGTAGKDMCLWDTEVKGFGLRVQPSGRRSYIYKFRTPDGRRRNRKIGEPESLTAEAARRIVLGMVSDAALGKVVIDDKPKQKSITMRKMCDLYLEDYARLHKKPKSVEDDTRYINKDIKPRLGSKSLSEIRSKDIVKIHSSLADTPIKANRLLALLSKIFNLSEEWEYRESNTNPTQHIRKYKETPRERFLTQDEIIVLEKVLADAEQKNEVSPSVIHALRVLLMTGARLQEVLTMKWEYVDFEEGKINLPDSKSGKKTIWLSDKARDYIDGIPHKRGNPFVFPGQRTGSRLVNLQKPWRKLRAIAEIEDVRIHDLRHTYASLAVSQNLSLPIVGKLLGHKSTKSTERYAHLYDEVMKEAANF